MYFMISLDVPQPPLYPSIWLFLPRVNSYWGLGTASPDLAVKRPSAKSMMTLNL